LPNKLKPLYPYLKRYRGHFFQGAAAVLLYNGARVLIPQIIGRAVDQVAHHGSMSIVTRQVLLLLLVASVAAVCLYATARAQRKRV